MSRLTDRYQSYLHYKGISFDEASFTATPTRTGSKLFNGNSVEMLDGNFASDGANNPTIQTGVMPNQKYYKFTFDNTVSPQQNARLIYGNTSTSTAGGLDDVRRLMWDSTPFDRIMGVWIKMSSSNNTMTAGAYPALVRWVYGTSAMINISAGLSPNNVPAITIIHSTTEFPSGAIINVYESYTDPNNNVVPIEWDKWYFVAIRKSVNETGGAGTVGSTMTGTIEYQHYINGESVNTITRTSWTKRSVNSIIFGNNNAIAKYDFGVSSWFVAESSDINQAALREIYKYGSPTNRPYPNADIRWTDGNNWYSASNEKVYSNGQWQDIFASRWDGANWSAI